MYKLRPTLWRTCRAIACETRLRLLWGIFKQNDLCVAELAHEVGISEQNASIQLRALSSRGLIMPLRQNLKIIYQPEANAELESVGDILDALHKNFENRMSYETVIQQATAFTHDRRIQIVRILKDSPATFGELLEKTGASIPALTLHLNKLEARRFVKLKGTHYMLTNPGNPLGHVLLKTACV